MGNFQKGDTILYSKSGYEYSDEIDEYGDRVVVDFHYNEEGTVLATLEDELLVLWKNRMICRWITSSDNITILK